MKFFNIYFLLIMIFFSLSGSIFALIFQIGENKKTICRLKIEIENIKNDNKILSGRFKKNIINEIRQQYEIDKILSGQNIIEIIEKNNKLTSWLATIEGTRRNTEKKTLFEEK